MENKNLLYLMLFVQLLCVAGLLNLYLRPNRLAETSATENSVKQRLSSEIIAPINTSENPINPADKPMDPATITQMSFENETVNFGTIKEGEKFEHKFVFKNTGTKPLIIDQSWGACGCTVPDWPKTPIAPGQTASINVIFNSTDKVGHQEKHVYVTANIPTKKMTLTLMGEVIGK